MCPLMLLQKSFSSLISNIEFHISLIMPHEMHSNNDLANSLSKFIEHTGKLMNALANKQETGEKGKDSGKRKQKEDVSHTPEEPRMLKEEAYNLVDDAHETIDTMLRQKLIAKGVKNSNVMKWKRNLNTKSA